MGGENDPSLYPHGERVLGWYRRDDLGPIARAVLPLALLTALGCVTVGVAHGWLSRLDPLVLQEGEGPIGRVESARAETSGRKMSRAERRAAELSVAPALPSRGPGPAGAWLFFALGLGLVAAGPLLMLWRLRGFMKREDFLLLRTDGLVHQTDALRLSLAWDELERVRYDDARDAISLVLRDPRPLPGSPEPAEAVLLSERFAGTSNARLAQQLEEIRRKATWGLLG